MSEIRTNRRRLLQIALIVAIVAGFVGHNLYAGGGLPQGGYTYEYTNAAAQRTLAGDCYDPNNQVQNICVELCLLTIDGHALPQGQFMCRPPFS